MPLILNIKYAKILTKFLIPPLEFIVRELIKNDVQKKWFFWLTLWFGITLLFVLGNWATLHGRIVEFGDWAANSLLIQDAKSFKLLIGIHSRAGFNHPGPAMLYVLAFGELIFHDWLHIVKSSIAGQIIMADVYKAFWMILFLNFFKKLTQSVIVSSLITLIFLLVIGLFDNQFLLGIWFPHLYIFPFAILLLSSSSLIYGKLDEPLQLALSCGFLINGHVCFVPIIGILSVLIVIFNTLICRFNKEIVPILSNKFLIENKHKLYKLFGIVFLFLIPLILETILHFPGPIPDYISFSKISTHHTSKEALNYLGYYWGGITSLLMGIIILGFTFFYSKAQTKDFRETAYSVLLILCAITFAFFVYAKDGVDFLSMTYIGLFYHAVPAILIAFAFFCIYQRIEISHKRILLFCLLFLCLLGLKKEVHKASINYDRPGGIAFFHELYPFKSDDNNRIVLDSNLVPDTWADILAAQIYAKRKHEDFFCVNNSWKLDFTLAAKCRPEEVIQATLTGRRFFLEMSENKNSLGLPIFKNTPGYVIYKYSEFKPLNKIDYRKLTPASDFKLFARELLVSGWMLYPSDKVARTDGHESHIFLPLKKDFSGGVILDVEAFLPSKTSTQSLKIFKNGVLFSDFKFNQLSSNKEIFVPIENLNSDYLDLKFIIEKPVWVFGTASQWGVSLKSLEVTKNK